MAHKQVISLIVFNDIDIYCKIKLIITIELIGITAVEPGQSKGGDPSHPETFKRMLPGRDPVPYISIRKRGDIP